MAMVCIAAAGQVRAQSIKSTTPTEKLLIIQGMIERQELNEARVEAAKAARQHSHDGGLENLQGVIEAQAHEVHGAAEYFKKAIRDQPTLIQAHLNLARTYLDSPGVFPDADEKATALYERVLALNHYSDEAHVQLASIDVRHQRYKEAMTQLDAVSRNQSSSTLVSLLRCGAAAGVGDRTQTDAAAETLLRDPQLQAADVLSIADGLRAGRRADLIAKLLEAVQTRGPLGPTGLELLGLAQDAEGKTREARATLEQAFAADPHSTKILEDLATVAERDGEGQAALGYLTHARDLAPHDAKLAYAFGQVCIRMKLLGEARNAMEHAFELEPENAEYALGLAKVTALSQDPLRALPYLKKYNALRPNDPQGVLLIGVVYYRVKDFDSAEPWLRRAEDSASTAAEAHRYLGSGYRQQGDVERASIELEKSVKMNDNEAETHAELGLLALGRKQREIAARELQRATGLEPQNYTANFGLLQLYALTNDPRRKTQLEHFEKMKEANEELNRQAMRVIEVNR